MPQVKGSALLTALFIMTLVAIVATAMSSKIQLDIYRTRLIVNHDKVYLASQAVTFWGLSELSNAKNKFNKADRQGIVALYPLNMEHADHSVAVKGALYDLQALYNINNLENKKSLLGFINLVAIAMPQTTEKERVNLALAINDWLSPYDLARGKDDYLSYYLRQTPPYYPSHQLMSSKSELRLIKEVSAPFYLALEPLITTLPEFTPININTAPPKVLKSLSSSMKETQVNELLKARKNGIKNLNKIAELLKKLDIATNQITLESSYFLSIAFASSDNINLATYTLYKRTQNKNKKISVNVMRESFNVF